MGYTTKLYRKRRRAALGAFVVVILACGCGSRGEGITLNSDGLHVGTSLSQRDRIAESKSNAELAQLRARTEIEQDRAAASIVESEKMGTVTRPVVLAIGLGVALGVAAIGLGYGAQRAEPALRTALEVKRARRLEVILEIGPGGYSAKLLTTGYDPGEVAQIVQAAPALNAPRLAELQARAGDRGVRLLAERGELETALARLPEPEPEVVEA